MTRHGSAVAIALLAALGTLSSVAVSAAEEAWRISSGDVRVLCPLTVGGSFEATTRALTGALTVASTGPIVFAGEVRVDLRTLETGIALRNEHLRDNYLEVSKAAGYETAVLTDVKLPDAHADASVFKSRFTATLRLHGVSKSIAGTAEVKRTGGRARIQARFPVSLPAFEIAKPRYLGVGVKDDVQVSVSFDAVQEGTGTDR